LQEHIERYVEESESERIIDIRVTENHGEVAIWS